MALFLVQHGKCLSKDIDPNRGLSEAGRADVTRIAETASAYNVHVSRILHSGKLRAAQTAEIIARILKVETIRSIDGIKPLDDVIAFAKTLPDHQDNTMLIGHLPFMERLAAFLITGSYENPVFQFQNGGIVCLDKYPETGRWVIKWALMPVVS